MGGNEWSNTSKQNLARHITPKYSRYIICEIVIPCHDLGFRVLTPGSNAGAFIQPPALPNPANVVLLL